MCLCLFFIPLLLHYFLCFISSSSPSPSFTSSLSHSLTPSRFEYQIYHSITEYHGITRMFEMNNDWIRIYFLSLFPLSLCFLNFLIFSFSVLFHLLPLYYSSVLFVFFFLFNQIILFSVSFLSFFLFVYRPLTSFW